MGKGVPSTFSESQHRLDHCSQEGYRCINQRDFFFKNDTFVEKIPKQKEVITMARLKLQLTKWEMYKWAILERQNSHTLTGKIRCIGLATSLAKIRKTKDLVIEYSHQVHAVESCFPLFENSLK